MTATAPDPSAPTLETVLARARSLFVTLDFGERQDFIEDLGKVLFNWRELGDDDDDEPDDDDDTAEIELPVVG